MSRALSAALGDERVLDPSRPGLVGVGDEIRVGRSRQRITALGVDGVRLAHIGGPSLSQRAWTNALDRAVARAAELAEAKVVVGAAIVRDGRLLAQQRAYPAATAGLWELPGGRVEPDESDVDAVRRECLEELGVEVTPLDVIGPDVVLRDDLVLRVYGATLDSGEPHPHDHQALAWLTEGTLHTVEWLPADRVLLAAVRTFLRTR
ncbi:putative mutT-like protein [Alloactinosynnema sp. L-07]|uniref:(deoxy)nucleoside triphosphate pyrophosphohydrolase n=1 Tax=Alloactinosynnema sp. L-07 TaxID=1653480 RepID=UPI00065EF4A0|nr:putative mutT-like protein [Alloactinosynnema sp. L-07]